MPGCWTSPRTAPRNRQWNGYGPAGAALPFQLFSDLVAVLNEQRLTRTEIVQKLFGFRYVVAVTGKVRYPLLLLGYMSLALHNVSLGLLEMAHLHRAISKLVGHGSAPFSLQAGAQIGLSATDAYGETLGR